MDNFICIHTAISALSGLYSDFEGQTIFHYQTCDAAIGHTVIEEQATVPRRYTPLLLVHVLVSTCC